MFTADYSLETVSLFCTCSRYSFSLLIYGHCMQCEATCIAIYRKKSQLFFLPIHIHVYIATYTLQPVTYNIMQKP